MRKVWKYIGITLAGLVLLIVFLLLFTQTAFFREKAKNQLVKIMEKNLELKVDIGQIDGNGYNYLKLNKIQLTQNDSAVVFISSVQLNFHLWSLRKRKIQIDSLLITKPEIRLSQLKDSSWNFNYFVKPKTKPTKKSQKPFTFVVQIDYFKLENSRIEIASPAQLIPTEINNLNLAASAYYSQNQVKVHLKNTAFSTQNPGLELNQLSGLYQMDETGIQLDSLLLLTGNSDIDLNGKYRSKSNLNTNIESNRIDKDELLLFIPKLKLLCSPSLKARFETINDSVSAHAELHYKDQVLLADVALNSLSNWLTKTDPLPFSAKLNFKNFTIEDWIETGGQQGLLDGEIQLNGENLLNRNSRTGIVANLENSTFKGILFDTLYFNGTYQDDSLTADINIHSDFGGVQLSGNLWNISNTPEYTAQLVSSDFYLSAFVPQLKGTLIEGKINVSGKGLNKKDLNAQARINIKNCSIYQLPIDSLSSDVLLNSSGIELDSFELQVPGAAFTGNGYFSLDSLVLESLIHAKIDSLTVIDSLVILPIAFDSVHTVSRISGPVNNLEIGGDVDIYNADAYSASLSFAKANYLISLKKDSLNVHVKTKAEKVNYSISEWDTVKAEVNYFKNEVDISANTIWQDTINAKIKTHIQTGDTIQIVVPELKVATLIANFYLEDTLRSTIYNMEKLKIEKFSIKEDSHPDFIVTANGWISGQDTNQFDLKINQLDLSQFNRFIPSDDTLKGNLGTELSLGGTALQPEIQGKLALNNPAFGQYRLSALESNFNYQNNLFKTDLKSADFDRAIQADISMPLGLYIDSLRFVFNAPETFNARLQLDSIYVAKMMKNLVPNDSINGTIHGAIQAKGDFKNPQFFGKIDLVNGHYLNKKLGIDYKDIKTSVILEGNRIVLDTVLVHRDGGVISVSGEMEFDSTIVKGNITSSTLKADANRFFLTQHRNYEILIDANTFVKTNDKNPEFGGKIRVIRSDVFLPAIFSQEKGSQENNVPMLVQALYTEEDSLILAAKTEEIKDRKSKFRSVLTENLTGRLSVEIPRNTWVKSNDMRLELSGEIDIAKTGPNFELFGIIEIIRGHYILYGKKLNIQESQIIFNGGEELDPNLNFVAEYVYRGSDKEKRYLKLIVNGKVSEPEITFMLDDAEITETDGISILIFGATSDEIGYSGQNGLISSVGSNAVAGVITSQLSKTIGTQFNLDMIEVTATENWQSAAFMVGKYITNDLFVMYQRGFGEVEGDEITPETVTLEYELNEIIFLRLQSGSAKTSGMDIILKFEQEKEK